MRIRGGLVTLAHVSLHGSFFLPVQQFHSASSRGFLRLLDHHGFCSGRRLEPNVRKMVPNRRDGPLREVNDWGKFLSLSDRGDAGGIASEEDGTVTYRHTLLVRSFLDEFDYPHAQVVAIADALEESVFGRDTF